MRVRTVHFNHDPAAATADAITLRENGQTVIAAPEWVDGGTSKPAAYVTQMITGDITVKASFAAGPPNATVPVRAINHLPSRRWWLAVWGESADVLGSLQPQPVSFDAGGDSPLISFTITADLSQIPIGIYSLKWIWQRLEDGVWTDFATTHHQIYILTWSPRPPWTAAGTEAAYGAFPWVGALEKACAWAEGATSIDEVMKKIAMAINGHPKLTYNQTGTRFVDGDQFILTDYLRELDRANSMTIDCRGVTTVLVTFANLLGAALMPLVIDPTPPAGSTSGGTFDTKKVKALSDGPWRGETWGWHEIAMRRPSSTDHSGRSVPGTPQLGAIDTPIAGAEHLHVYDALLSFDKYAPSVALDKPLGLCNVPGSGYRYDLVQTRAADRAVRRQIRSVI